MPLQFGFAPGRHTTEVITALRRAARKAAEWGDGLRTASLDVEQDCEHIEACSVERPPLEHHALAWAIAAALLPSVAGVDCDISVVLGNGARQSAPGNPIMWKSVVRAFTCPLVQELHNEPVLECCPTLAPWPFFLYADNTYGIADTPMK